MSYQHQPPLTPRKGVAHGQLAQAVTTATRALETVRDLMPSDVPERDIAWLHRGIEGLDSLDACLYLARARLADLDEATRWGRIQEDLAGR